MDIKIRSFVSSLNTLPKTENLSNIGKETVNLKTEKKSLRNHKHGMDMTILPFSMVLSGSPNLNPNESKNIVI